MNMQTTLKKEKTINLTKTELSGFLSLSHSTSAILGLNEFKNYIGGEASPIQAKSALNILKKLYEFSPEYFKNENVIFELLTDAALLNITPVFEFLKDKKLIKKNTNFALIIKNLINYFKFSRSLDNKFTKSKNLLLINTYVDLVDKSSSHIIYKNIEYGLLSQCPISYLKTISILNKKYDNISENKYVIDFINSIFMNHSCISNKVFKDDKIFKNILSLVDLISPSQGSMIANKILNKINLGTIDFNLENNASYSIPNLKIFIKKKNSIPKNHLIFMSVLLAKILPHNKLKEKATVSLISKHPALNYYYTLSSRDGLDNLLSNKSDLKNKFKI